MRLSLFRPETFQIILVLLHACVRSVSTGVVSREPIVFISRYLNRHTPYAPNDVVVCTRRRPSEDESDLTACLSRVVYFVDDHVNRFFVVVRAYTRICAQTVYGTRTDDRVFIRA